MTSSVAARGGLSKKLLLVFALQLAAISFAIVFGVWASASVLERSLMREALLGEADLFAERLAENPQTPTPDTVNLTTYIASRFIPEKFVDLKAGFHDIEDDGVRVIVYVRDLPQQDRLVMRFDAEHVFELAIYFGLIPLTGVLISIYLTAWVAYRLSRRTISPIVSLARKVEALDPDDFEPGVFAVPEDGDLNEEVATLREALEHLSSRVHELLQRERAFTRDVSHELRTPLSVIQMSADALSGSVESGTREERTLTRIRRSAREMHVMLNALLAMARHNDGQISTKEFSVNDIVQTEVERADFFLSHRDITIHLKQTHTMSAVGVPQIASILVGQMIKTVASRMASGNLCIRVGPGFVAVDAAAAGTQTARDVPAQCPDMTTTSETITDRLARFFHWPLHRTDDDNGVQATMYFPCATFTSQSDDAD